MDAYQIAVLVLAAMNAIAIPLARDIYRRLEVINKEFSAYQLHVAEKYVTNDQLEKHFERIEKSIDELKVLIKS
jgi:guanylate kinase